MIPGPLQGRLQVALRSDPGLRAGETVVVHVIKRLDGSAAPTGAAQKWAVAVGGRVYPASSDVPLDPGAVLRARVSHSQGKTFLSLTTVLPDEPRDAVGSAARALGLAPGSDGELVVRALAQSGLPLLPETVQKIRALLTRAGVDARQGARAAAILVDKGIDASGETARALLPVLAFGQKGGDDPRRYRRRPLPDTPSGVKAWAAGLAGDGRGAGIAERLQAFNHARGRSETWVVIPFSFSMGAKDEGPPLAGTIRIKYDPYRARPLALSVVTEGIAFHLPLEGTGKLSVYADEPLRTAARAGLDRLKSKINNMGREVDDTVNEGDGFDGFSPGSAGAGLPSVDAVG
jgi:hypothetical protein